MDTQKLADAILDRIFVELEASARHVHLTEAQSHALFGHDLTPGRPLSQPGQFLARERLTLQGPKGAITHVAVLGPARGKAQVELSMTDCIALGVSAPVRLSGDVQATPGITLVGAMGQVVLPQGVIIAQRHIHMTPEKAAIFGLADGDRVNLRTYTQRPVTFGDVVVRVSPKFATYVHLDYDEANACGMKKGDLGRILLC